MVMRGCGGVLRGFRHLMMRVFRHRMPGRRVILRHYLRRRTMPVRAQQHARGGIAAQWHCGEQQQEQKGAKTA